MARQLGKSLLCTQQLQQAIRTKQLHCHTRLYFQHKRSNPCSCHIHKYRNNKKENRQRCQIPDSSLFSSQSLYVNIQNRRPAFAINETCLAFSEFVLGKKKLNHGLVKTKLQQFWVKAKVVKKLGQTYILKLPNGAEKRYHERQMKKYTLDDIQSEHNTTSSIDSDSL